VDALWVYDNTSIDAEHPLVLEARNGEILFIEDPPRPWLREALEFS
jgi:hypothetical protein